MILPPGYGSDLDTLTDAAVRDGIPNTLIKDDQDSIEVPLATVACIQGRLDLVEVLLNAGAALSSGDMNHIIWWRADEGTIRFLLAHGIPFDADCLYTATRRGDWHLVHLLLEQGEEGQMPGKTSLALFPAEPDRISLLHITAWRGVGWLVKYLLERGADRECRDQDGLTPLLKACELDGNPNHTSYEAIFWLLKYGSVVNATTPRGETPLILCTGKSTNSPIRRTTIAQMLLRYGANPNVTAPNGATPLMFAARDNDRSLAKALLRAGADTKTKTPGGETALDVARRHESDHLYDLLWELQ